MRWLRLALLFAAGALGCGGQGSTAPDRARLWTLLDLAAIFDADPQATIAAGPDFPDGLPVSYFLTEGTDPFTGGKLDTDELAVSSGFIEGKAANFTTTELWANFEHVWTQPLYTAVGADGNLPNTADVREPWVFGVGPRSRFYSPFWEVLGFQVPDGVAAEDLLDTRAVIEAANQTGGFRQLERRIVAAAPKVVFPNFQWTEQTYYDDVAAWDGAGQKRYIDFGTGRFDYDDAGVVKEDPLFVFMKGGVLMKDWPHIGGTRPLFSATPPLTGADAGAGGTGGGAAPLPDPVAIEPSFGGLWRLHTVELPSDAGLVEGRVVLHLPCGTNVYDACVVLDSQGAIESAGPDRIHRTELLATCPLLQLGDTLFPRVPSGPNPPPGK